jgi:hypothetical protein
MIDSCSRRRILTGASALALAGCASTALTPTGPPPAYMPSPASPPAPRNPPPKGDGDESATSGDPEIDHCWAQLWAGAAASIEEVNTWRARWPRMEDAPDYAHARTWPVFRDGYEIRGGFTLDSNVLARMAATNHFPASYGVMLFGLRGCEILDREKIGQIVGNVRLRPRAPSHFEPHCVIGVWLKEDNKIAVCEGSTVPAAYYMRDQAVAAVMRRTLPDCGPEFYSGICNLMPTGWYRYHVGVHGQSSGKNWGECEFEGRLLNGALIGALPIPGAFRLDSEATTLRTVSDLVYKHDDVWCVGQPFDNIHAARSDTMRGTGAPEKFSSGGCQVLVGDYNGRHSDQWAQYRAAAGLAENYAGHVSHKFRYMLLTGHDAMLAATSGDSYTSTSRYAHIRQGSSMTGVERLQELLNRRARSHGAPFTSLKVEQAFGPRSAFALMRHAPPEWSQRAPIISVSRITAL